METNLKLYYLILELYSECAEDKIEEKKLIIQPEGFFSGSISQEDNTC